MPGLFHRPLNRRNFLSGSTALLAGCALAPRLRAAAPPDKGAVRLALLSDTHIPADSQNVYRGFFPEKNLKTVIPQVLDARPEGVLINGDAARLTGELADYEMLKSLLGPVAAQCPIYIGLGNHDNRETFFKVFPVPAGTRPVVADKQVLLLERAGLRFIVLDSLLYVNKVAGLLGKTQRDWLKQFLDQSDDRPTVLFVHHTLKDGDGDLLDIDRLFALVRPHKKVKAIFYGHSHQYAFSRHENLHLINLPAVGYNFNDQEPVGWVDAQFTPAGADLTLKTIGGNQTANGRTTSLAWM